jgi:hypothetical protein
MRTTHHTKEMLMKKGHRILVPALLLPLMLFGTEVVSQELHPEQVLPELSAEDRAARGAGNVLAMAQGLIAYAREHDQSIADAGRFAGEFFAKTWPAELTPSYFVRAMNANLQMFSTRTQVLEVSDRHVTARRDRIPTEEAFVRAYRIGDVTYEEFETFMRNITVGIASSRGLDYTERAEDDHVVFTVSVGS